MSSKHVELFGFSNLLFNNVYSKPLNDCYYVFLLTKVNSIWLLMEQISRLLPFEEGMNNSITWTIPKTLLEVSEFQGIKPILETSGLIQNSASWNRDVRRRRAFSTAFFIIEQTLKLWKTLKSRIWMCFMVAVAPFSSPLQFREKPRTGPELNNTCITCRCQKCAIQLLLSRPASVRRVKYWSQHHWLDSCTGKLQH